MLLASMGSSVGWVAESRTSWPSWPGSLVSRDGWFLLTTSLRASAVFSWGELIAIPHCIDAGCTWERVEAGLCPNKGPLVLMDEADLWFPSEAWRSPVEVNKWLKQLRKLGITMCWATSMRSFLVAVSVV